MSKLKIGAALFALLLLVIMFVVLKPGWIVNILAKRSPEVLYFVETQEPAEVSPKLYHVDSSNHAQQCVDERFF
jgi:cytochrome b561